MLKRRLYYTLLSIWGITYVVGSLVAPIAPNRFDLSTTKTKVLQLTLALPIVLIWAAAVYGAERFKSYAQKIKNYPDGKALNLVANGLIILVASILFNGFSGILRPWALKDGWLPQFTILFNFISAVLPLIAYIFMYSGSKELLKLTKSVRKYSASWIPVVAIIALLGAVYITVIYGYDYRGNTPNPAKFSSFYLPDGLILSTLAVPYLVGWALGIKAALNIWAYMHEIKGTIYKKALRRVVAGILLVIACAVIIQLFIAFSTYFSKAGLAAILLIVYLLIVFYSLGFLVLASGTKGLNAIEKVKP
jgi:hypothetical protein